MTIKEVVEKLIEKVGLPGVSSYEAEVKYDLPNLQSKLNIHFKSPVEKKRKGKRIYSQELDEQVLSYIGFDTVFDGDKLNIGSWLDKCKTLIEGLGMDRALFSISLKKIGRRDFVYVPEDEEISEKVNRYHSIEDLTSEALKFSELGNVKGYNLSHLPGYKKTPCKGGYIKWLHFTPFLFNLKIVCTNDAIIYYAPVLDKILG